MDARYSPARPANRGLATGLDTPACGWFHPQVQTFQPPPRALVNLLFAGALLRLIGLGFHALWLDEGATWSWAARATWGGTIFAEANHPPAWWVVTRLWIGAFGDSEASLRAPAGILGIVSIYLSYLLALRLLDPTRRPRRGGFDRTPDGGRGARQAIWVAGFVALSTYFTEYAQEARMYSALIAEGLGLSLLYLRWLDRNDRASLIGYALLAALALYTQYFAIWIIAGHAAHALFLWRAHRGTDTPFDLRPFAVSCVAAGALFVPWFLYLLGNYEGISTGEAFNPFTRLFYVLWRIGAGPGLVVVDRPRLEEGITAVLQEEAVLAAVTSLLWFAPIVVGVRVVARQSGVRSFVAANVLVPIGLLLLVFPFFALIHERYLVFLAPWLVLLAVVGAFEASRTVRPFLIAGLVLLLAMGVFAYHAARMELVAVDISQPLGNVLVPRRFDPDPQEPAHVLHHGHPFGKEPWRQAHAFVERYSRPEPEGEMRGDLVLLHPPYLHLVWDYYDRGVHDLAFLPRETLDEAALEPLLEEALQGRDRIFLILAHEETYDADGTKDPDHYFRVLRGLIGRRWWQEGMTRFQVVEPILFNLSWGVRVAVFNRR